MEALAHAYGSDSDSSRDDTPLRKGPSSVLDNYSGCVNNRVDSQPYSALDTSLSVGTNIPETSTNIHCDQVTTDINVNASSPSNGILPIPRLLVTSTTKSIHHEDIVLFPKNYLLEKNHYKDPDVTLNLALIKLQEDGGSFALKLKQQKEFGNKSVFQSVIEYFNIDPMGSNIDRNKFSAFEYIDRMLMKEE